MTIEDMAREAGMHQDGDNWYCVGPGKYDDHDVTTEALTRFAALIRAQALEDAARVCEGTATCLLPTGSFLSERCAAAVRALTDKP